MVDPALCPIPPGFEVYDNISDDFERFKTVTGYGSRLPNRGWHGYSMRWKNKKIESDSVVVGFQFKIGPDIARRWKDPGFFGEPSEFQERYDGDISVHFPRTEHTTMERGGYGLLMKWYKEDHPTQDGLLSEGILFKEIPHGTYSGDFGWNGMFNVDNPRPNIGQIKDGRWHGFLAAVYIDHHSVGRPVTMKLWYNPNDTYDFNDFIFLGMGVDNTEKPIPPRGPLRWGVVDDGLGSGVWGNSIFTIEHDLQIRIDDIPPEQVEIKNMYAANVILRDVPPPPPDNHDGTVSICAGEYKVLSEAYAKIDELNMEITDLQGQLGETPPGTDRDNIMIRLKNIHENLLPKAWTEVESAKINYNDCINQGPAVWHRDGSIVMQ